MSPANGGMMKKLTPNLPDEPCYFEYVPTKGKNANKLTKVYFIKKQNVVFIEDQSFVDEESKQIVKTVNVHNNWTNESLWQGISKEGDVKLKNGKKPEKLIKRILEISTNEGDLVLDYHLGSGTTAAVAEKLNRKWICSDIGKFSIHAIRKRMIDIQRTQKKEEKDWRAFEILNLGKYQRKHFIYDGKSERDEIKQYQKAQKEKEFERERERKRKNGRERERMDEREKKKEWMRERKRMEEREKKKEWKREKERTDRWTDKATC